MWFLARRLSSSIRMGAWKCEETIAKQKGFSNEEESIIELAAADGIWPCSACASERVFTRLWLNFSEERGPHERRPTWALFGKGRMAVSSKFQSIH